MTCPNTARLSGRATASSRPRAASAAGYGSLNDMASARGGAALLEHAADLLHGLGDRLLHALHVPSREGDQAHVGLRGDRGRPQHALEQADLAEEVTGTEVRDVLAAAGDVGLAVLYRHELVGELALLHEHGPGLDLALLGEGRDLGQLRVGNGREERDRLQALDIHAGGPYPTRRSPRQSRHPSSARATAARLLRPVPLPDLLRALLTAPGPSGYEGAPARVWREAAEGFAEVGGDTLGSSTARVAAVGDGPRLALVGHIDEIGLVVTHVDDEGYLYFAGVGGWDWQILVGQRVEVITRDGHLPGVVGKKPIHLLKEDDRKKVADVKDLHIDIGARDGDEARDLVRIGDVAVIAGEPVQLPNDRVVSRSMDNRLGAFVVYEAARLVAEAGGAPGDVVAGAAVQGG